MTYRSWVRANAAQLRVEADRVASTSCAGWRRSAQIRDRAKALELCGTMARGYECNACGAPSGRAQLVGEGQPCHARTCPRCARVRTVKSGAWAGKLEALIDRMCSPGDSWSLKLFTITAEYNPRDPNDVSAVALRARHDGLRRVWKALLGDLRKTAGPRRKEVGDVLSVEVAGKGHVHLHVLAWCPFVDKARMEWIGDLTWARCGWIDVRKCDRDAVKEVLKYPLKLPGQKKEIGDWYGGELREVISPVLAARWEVALWGCRINERHGSFRQLPDVESAEVTEAPEPPEQHACTACGCVDGWHEVTEPLTVWAIKCRHAGVPVLGTPLTLEEWGRRRKIEAEIREREKAKKARKRDGPTSEAPAAVVAAPKKAGPVQLNMKFLRRVVGHGG